MNCGDTVSHHPIDSLLGVGGMGEVHLAEDLTLGRKVALKFLSSVVTADVATMKSASTQARRSSPWSQRLTRVGIWVGDGLATKGAETMPLTLGSRGDVAWAADRLVYTSFIAGHASIVSAAPDRGIPEEIGLNGIGPGATSDGRTIVYVSKETGSKAGLWKADRDGSHATQLVSGPIMIDIAST